MAKLHSPHSTSNRATPTRRGTTTRAYDGKAYCRSWVPLVASDGSTLRLELVQWSKISDRFGSGRLTWKTKEQKDREEEAKRRERPNDANDPPRSSRSRQRVVQLIAPEPQCGNPDLLRTLDDARTKDPHFRGGSSFFTKVETEEGEATRGSYGVRVCCNGGDDVVSGGQACVDVGESDKEESDTEEEPRKGKGPDRRSETEEQVPNSRSGEEDRANDVQLEIGLPI